MSSLELKSPGTPGAETVAAGGEHWARGRAMATEITIRVPGGAGDPGVAAAVDEALEVFAKVERACTRFNPASPLMQANASPYRFHRVPRECFEAIQLAHGGYEATKGGFDPRVLRDLVQLGYDRTLDFAGSAVSVDTPHPPAARPALGPWRPRFRGSRSEVLLGDDPVDLGGVGKGLAVRWASEVLAERRIASYLVEAGGDCHCGGSPAEGGRWRIGVEDPRGSDTPVAVLEISDLACTTSSIRLRSWQVSGRSVHHLIDPRTGLPGGSGVLAVTVVGPDAAWAEIWSKTLLLAGARRIASLASQRSLAALWVTDDGSLHSSRGMERHLAWARGAAE
jgi:thiamine biosynthesis lipoprotein